MAGLKQLSYLTVVVFASVLFIGGCDFFKTVDSENAKVEFKHTIKLPSGFTIVSTVPLNMSVLKESEEDPDKFWENEAFAIEALVTNDNQHRENTKVRFTYDSSQISSIHIYRNDGSPFRHIGGNLYEFSKEVLPGSKSPIYIAGEIAPINENYEYVPLEFHVSYLSTDDKEIGADSYKIEAYNSDYQAPSTSSS